MDQLKQRETFRNEANQKVHPVLLDAMKRLPTDQFLVLYSVVIEAESFDSVSVTMGYESPQSVKLLYEQGMSKMRELLANSPSDPRTTETT